MARLTRGPRGSGAIHCDVSEAAEGGEPKALPEPAASASQAPSDDGAAGVDTVKGSPM